LIPIRDSVRSRSVPLVSLSIIAINVLVFLRELGMTDRELWKFAAMYGVVPARLSGLFTGHPQGVWFVATLFTAQFLHGGWFHLLGNMLYLWVFGDNVEDRMGRWRFLGFYLVAGALANFAHAVMHPTSMTPTIGASGAVAGVLGAYFVMFPRARVQALLPLGFFLYVTELPAVLFLFLWFFLQLASGVASIGLPPAVTGAVAWWAHVGGFLVGMFLGPSVARRPRRRMWY